MRREREKRGIHKKKTQNTTAFEAIPLLFSLVSILPSLVDIDKIVHVFSTPPRQGQSPLCTTGFNRMTVRARKGGEKKWDTK